MLTRYSLGNAPANNFGFESAVILLLWLPGTARNLKDFSDAMSPGACNIDGSNSRDHSYDDRYPNTRTNHTCLCEYSTSCFHPCYLFMSSHECLLFFIINIGSRIRDKQPNNQVSDPPSSAKFVVMILI